MNCLTKKSLYFLVLSIVCKSALSDRTKECITDVNKVFLPFMPPWFYFKLAMTLISQTVIESKSPEEIIKYFKNHEEEYFRYSDADTTSLFKQEKIDFFWYVRLNKKWKLITRIDASNIDKTSGESKKQHIFGYFHYLVSKLDKLAMFINEIAMSPKQFCEEYDKNEYSLCINALYAMLNLRDVISKTELNEMRGYNAFIHCYLNYTYDDFTIDIFFPKLGNSDEYQKPGTSSSGSGSDIHQDESIQQLQIGIMIEYFRHMFYVSTKIAELNENKGLKLIPTVEEYCIEATNI